MGYATETHEDRKEKEFKKGVARRVKEERKEADRNKEMHEGSDDCMKCIDSCGETVFRFIAASPCCYILCCCGCGLDCHCESYCSWFETCMGESLSSWCCGWE